MIVYQMLAGQLPFGAEHVPLPKFLRMILTEGPVPLRQVNPDIGVEIESVVMRALDRDPNARPSALGFATDLRHAVELLLDLDTQSFTSPNLCVEDEQ